MTARILGVLLFLSACGGTRSTSDAAPIDAGIFDAGDAGFVCGDTCDPVKNTGCTADTRCGTIVRAIPCLMDCVPAGTTPIGAACARAADGTDDCVARSACVDGVCRPFCVESGLGCDAGVCDLFVGTEVSWLGVCK